MHAHRFVAVVGARKLPAAWAAQVEEVVRFLLGRGWGVGSGGARGADQFALEAVVAAGAGACRRSVVFLPHAQPAAPGGALGAFVARGGRVVAGSGAGRAALLGRSRRLVAASSGVVAFLWGPSRGSVFTLRESVRAGKPAALVLAGGGAQFPGFAGGRWVPWTLGAITAFRWVPDIATSDADGASPARKALHRIFVVPDGEPVHALMAHISSLSAGERLWFEHGVLAGDTVVVPHEALSDTPAFLAAPRLRRRFGCTVPEAVGLAELFVALEAGPDVVAHCAAEARRRSAGAVIEDLVHLVAQLALAEEIAGDDAGAEAACLGDAVDDVSTEGGVEEPRADGDADSAMLGWHAVGSVHVEQVACPACGAEYGADDESTEIPGCPECSVTNTWEARQGAAYRAFIDEIDGCGTLVELAALGKRLYARQLSHDQAGVAWTHYTLRKAALEAAITLGAPAQALVGEVERATARALPALGARLYRLQHGGEAGVRPEEWRRIWHAYHARRRARAA
jgi:hypothetical protein